MSSIRDLLNVDCPSCGQHGGHIVSMPVDAAVSYRCLQCGHEWQISNTLEGTQNGEATERVYSKS